MSGRIGTCARCAITAVVFVGCLSGPSIGSRDAVASICENAALFVSRETDVPLDVLRAISLTETGRRKNGSFLPWPWTVNMEGVGKWFEDVASAKEYVNRHFERGARSFDVGCFQINFKWHGQAFASIDEMFDPITNARYAARFLSELHFEFGDWSKAAGAYHSRTPKFARKYTARFDRIRSRLSDLPNTHTHKPLEEHVLAQVKPASAPNVQNTYPFFLGGRSSGRASLVPLDLGGTALIEDNARALMDTR